MDLSVFQFYSKTEAYPSEFVLKFILVPITHQGQVSGPEGFAEVFSRKRPFRIIFVDF
jgi:hypothetical protein